MKYELVNCHLVEEGQDVNGKKAKALYLATTAVSARNSDNGFSLPMFNPGFIIAARQCIQQELDLDKMLTQYFQEKGAIIEDRTVQLSAVYFRRKEVNGKLTNDYTVGKDGKPQLYTSLNLHCIYSMPMEDAYDKDGVILMEQDFKEVRNPDGTITAIPYMRPKRKYVLDELTGRPKKEYWQGWSPTERRDQVLSMFYMLAPKEYQGITGPEIQQQPPVQPQQQNGTTANPFMQNDPMQQQQPQQQPPQPQIDPLNQQ